jgi:DNA-binding Lrp family transcriptional regulator|tara:strand:+ start:414 stop:923 length:510 start_codon:yes stop_codon:yes gene_type:complete
MIKEKLKLDDRDNIIIQMLQKNPQTSQEEIAKVLKLSQPSVWARIKNLREKGVIKHIVGMDFKTVDLNLAKVDVSATDTQAVIDEFKDCPYFINALITSGKFNVCLFFTGTDLRNIEGIVNHHLRGNPKVKDIELNIVISTANSFVLPLNLDCSKKKVDCNKECETCLD